MTWRCSFSSNQFCSDRVKQISTSLRFRAVLIEVPNGWPKPRSLMRTTFAMLSAGKLAASTKNKNAGSKPPRGGQGGLHDDFTPELRSSRCNERCCCRCLARDCATCNQVAARVELSEEYRRSVGSEPDARQIRERDERRQVHHRSLCGGGGRAPAAGAG